MAHTADLAHTIKQITHGQAYLNAVWQYMMCTTDLVVGHRRGRWYR